MPYRIRTYVLAAACATMAPEAAITQAPLRVLSPDGRTQVSVATRDGGLYYTVERDGRPLLLRSRLGFEFQGAPALRDGLRIVGSTTSSRDTTWTQPWGEVARVRDHHN
ncbi:MAG TPA: glycoside hydrolase family 97 N-terminal domain-containing protein, partial [Gemmatimonadaceae bacterium]|nr:glycoside hydrolase family 97 N-terminal domain-containing protein [Gemmatimonadaceae bacterium]